MKNVFKLYSLKSPLSKRRWRGRTTKLDNKRGKITLLNIKYGDTQQFNLVGKEEGNVGTYGVVALKNLTWPGA